MLPSNSRCPLSIEVAKDKCEAAGLAVGGVLQNDGVVEGSWDNKPNGCFFQPEIHYNDLPRIQIKSAGYNARDNRDLDTQTFPGSSEQFDIIKSSDDSPWHPICNKMEVRFLNAFIDFFSRVTSSHSHYETICFL